MKRYWLRIIALTLVVAATGAFVLPLVAQLPAPPPANPQARQIHGLVVELGSGEFVIKTDDNKRMIISVNPQTKFMMNNKIVGLGDVRVGSEVTITVVAPTEKEVAHTVTLLGPPAVVPANELLIEGQVVRTIGPDQVVVMTPDRKEVIVYVEPATKYTFDNRVGAYTDLRPGAQIRVNANVRDGRHFARQIVVPANRR